MIEGLTGFGVARMVLYKQRLFFSSYSIEEQNETVFEIESRDSEADKTKESIRQSLQQTEGLRQSILKKAFEGNLC